MFEPHKPPQQLKDDTLLKKPHFVKNAQLKSRVMKYVVKTSYLQYIKEKANIFMILKQWEDQSQGFTRYVFPKEVETIYQNVVCSQE